MHALDPLDCIRSAAVVTAGDCDFIPLHNGVQEQGGVCEHASVCPTEGNHGDGLQECVRASFLIIIFFHDRRPHQLHRGSFYKAQ